MHPQSLRWRAATAVSLCLAAVLVTPPALANAALDGVQVPQQQDQQQQHPLGGTIKHDADKPHDISAAQDNNDGSADASRKSTRKRKNIVFILTDDQDLVMDSPEYMPFLREHMIDQGITYKNHFTSTSICCPSRVSLLTGKLPHNTNVTDVNPPYGGYPKFVSQGLNSNYLPVWLQHAGYSTYYVGKLFNAHNTRNYDSPHAAGWTGSDFLLDPGTYSFLNPIFQRNTEKPVHHRQEHTAELTADKALGFLREALGQREKEQDESEEGEKPFFLAVAPISPHTNIDSNNHEAGGGPPLMTEPVPLDRHAKLFDGVQVPRTDNFNPDKPSSVSWISKLAQFNATSVAYLDHFYRQRLRSLQSVDELLDSIVGTLKAHDALDDTYIIYSSDNGYHIGQHRLPPGKMCAFEEDIRVPLYIRGPGIKRGVEEKGVTAHVDLAPTLLELAGVQMREDFDGRPVPLEKILAEETGEVAPVAQQNHRRLEHASIEFWGLALAEGEGGGFDGKGKLGIRDNTYKALRVLGPGYDLSYAVWCNNEHELYDLTTDPGQLNNLYPKDNHASGQKPNGINDGDDVNDEGNDDKPVLDTNKIARVINRLDALMMVLKSCQGAASCADPWSILHPPQSTQDDDEQVVPRVQTLSDALHSQYDEFYANQPKVEFGRCEMGYIVDAEGPQEVNQFLFQENGGKEGEHEELMGNIWPLWT